MLRLPADRPTSGTPLLLAEAVDHASLLGGRAAPHLARRRGALVAAEGGLATVRASALEEVAPGSVALVVSAGALCSVEDMARTCTALSSCLAAEGQVQFLEHVDRVRWPGRIQAAIDPLWRRCSGGCHIDRDIPAALRQAGLFVPDLERFTMPTPVPFLRPWVQGRAIHPPRRVR